MQSLDLFKSQVAVIQDYPEGRIDRDNSFLLFDQALLQSTDLDLQAFIKSFPHQLSVKAGEDLKDFKSFPKNLELILKKWPDPITRSQNLVVLGGGSLGDFAGFVASILKRGVGLIHIPSTWLSAIDSSHGGKTGLNYNGVKNQIGTFYPASTVYIIRPLLDQVPQEIKDQSYGELIKMGLIGDSKFFKDISMEKREAHDFLWRFLPQCIEDKYSVILQDPFETKEIRQILNFGHTFGHALESHFSWSHGDAVLQGIFFSLEWSRHKGLLSESLCEQFYRTISDKFDRGPAHQFKWYKKPNEKNILKLLQADKKIDIEGNILFVFLKNLGQPHIERVSVSDLLEEAKRQSWVK